MEPPWVECSRSNVRGGNVTLTPHTLLTRQRMKIIPSGQILGATIQGLDLSQPLPPGAFDEVVRALGRYSVIRFPEQELSGQNLKDFSAQFGTLEVNVANFYQEPGIPEVMILSNIVENGKPIGFADAEIGRASG